VSLDRRFRRLAREERRSFKALVVATGARPVPESSDEPADQEA
jgi:hypothetical protein